MALWRRGQKAGSVVTRTIVDDAAAATREVKAAIEMLTKAAAQIEGRKWLNRNDYIEQ
jgi:hypothetical protein